jgi:hypothetical protein
MMTWGFTTLWIVGWICFINLFALVGKDFRSTNNTNEEKDKTLSKKIDKIFTANK